MTFEMVVFHCLFCLFFIRVFGLQILTLGGIISFYETLEHLRGLEKIHGDLHLHSGEHKIGAITVLGELSLKHNLLNLMSRPKRWCESWGNYAQISI